MVISYSSLRQNYRLQAFLSVRKRVTPASGSKHSVMEMEVPPLPNRSLDHAPMAILRVTPDSGRRWCCKTREKKTRGASINTRTCDSNNSNPCPNHQIPTCVSHTIPAKKNRCGLNFTTATKKMWVASSSAPKISISRFFGKMMSRSRATPTSSC